ncbi:TOBE domain-containing protein [Parafrigoribacterium soli]|uniref:TOBE domain-containing protein n=1 Tax=Parafrigoribacterium soli TaxID=3144663 RepID=UPI0032EBB385
MAQHRFRVSEAAALLGVSDDTVRRWAEFGRLTLVKGENGRSLVDGVELAALAQANALDAASEAGGSRSSARNRLRGIVTKVTKDTVMAQVELQAGPFRLVSLMSREAVDQLRLEVGSLAIASVKATTVVIDLPEQ